MMLSTEEKQRFAAYLEMDVESNRQLIRQPEKIPGADAILKLKKQQVVAAMIVLNGLVDAESQSISPSDSGPIVGAGKARLA